MHLIPHEDFRPADDAGGAAASPPQSTPSAPDPHATQAWPRPVNPRRPGGPDSHRTRSDLANLARLADRIAEPTTKLPQVPAPGGVVNGPGHAIVGDLNARTAAGTLRIRRFGPGGLFGWKPLDRPSLREVAAARQRAADREERRRHAHQRHMDALERVRAYLGIVALVLLIAFVAAAAFLAFGILSGWYTWMPVRHS